MLLDIEEQTEGGVGPQAAAEGFRGLRLLLRAFRVLLGARLLLGIRGQAEGWLGPQAAAEGFRGLRLLLRAFGVLLGARLLLHTRCRLLDLLHFSGVLRWWWLRRWASLGLVQVLGRRPWAKSLREVLG